MPDREEATLTAIYNRLQRKREELLAEAENLAEQMRNTQELAKTLGQVTPGTARPGKPIGSPISHPKEKIPVTKLLEDFIRDEKMPRQFTAPQLVQYINSRGFYGENLYSSAFETLRRKVKKHQINKEGDKFIVPEGEQDNGTSSAVSSSEPDGGRGE